MTQQNKRCAFCNAYKQKIRKEDAIMLKKLFSRKNPYTTAIKKDIADIKAMSKQYEETRKQLVKNVETINTLMGEVNNENKFNLYHR